MTMKKSIVNITIFFTSQWREFFEVIVSIQMIQEDDLNCNLKGNVMVLDTSREVVIRTPEAHLILHN
jgi:hypothetical protein